MPNHFSAASDPGRDDWTNLPPDELFWAPANLRAWLGDSGSIAPAILAALWLWTDGGS